MLFLQPRLLAFDLLEQRPADAADAHQEDFDHLIGVKQHLMRDANARGGVVVVDHDGD